VDRKSKRRSIEGGSVSHLRDLSCGRCPHAPGYGSRELGSLNSVQLTSASSRNTASLQSDVCCFHQPGQFTARRSAKKERSRELRPRAGWPSKFQGDVGIRRSSVRGATPIRMWVQQERRAAGKRTSKLLALTRLLRTCATACRRRKLEWTL